MFYAIFHSEFNQENCFDIIKTNFKEYIIQKLVVFINLFDTVRDETNLLWFGLVYRCRYYGNPLGFNQSSHPYPTKNNTTPNQTSTWPSSYCKSCSQSVLSIIRQLPVWMWNEFPEWMVLLVIGNRRQYYYLWSANYQSEGHSRRQFVSVLNTL